MKKSMHVIGVLPLLSGKVVDRSAGVRFMLSDRTAGQMDQIIIQLTIQKKAAFRLADRASIGMRLQVIENSRDSLYGIILNAAQLEAYKRKKGQWLARPSN